MFHRSQIVVIGSVVRSGRAADRHANGGILCWIPEDGFGPTGPSLLEDDEIGALQSDIWLGRITPYERALGGSCADCVDADRQPARLLQ